MSNFSLKSLADFWVILQFSLKVANSSRESRVTLSLKILTPDTNCYFVFCRKEHYKRKQTLSPSLLAKFNFCLHLFLERKSGRLLWFVLRRFVFPLDIAFVHCLQEIRNLDNKRKLQCLLSQNNSFSLTRFMALLSSVVAILICSRAVSMKGLSLFLSWASEMAVSALAIICIIEALMERYASIRVFWTWNFVQDIFQAHL